MSGPRFSDTGSLLRKGPNGGRRQFQHLILNPADSNEHWLVFPKCCISNDYRVGSNLYPEGRPDSPLRFTFMRVLPSAGNSVCVSQSLCMAIRHSLCYSLFGDDSSSILGLSSDNNSRCLTPNVSLFHIFLSENVIFSDRFRKFRSVDNLVQWLLRSRRVATVPDAGFEWSPYCESQPFYVGDRECPSLSVHNHPPTRAPSLPPSDHSRPRSFYDDCLSRFLPALVEDRV